MHAANREKGLALNRRVTEYEGLDTFNAPEGLVKVTLISDEVGGVCPVTGYPDWYTVKATYLLNSVDSKPGRCIESKTWKLFLQSFRNKGIFCEQLSQLILDELVRAVEPRYATVEVTQKPRGGVSIIAESVYDKETSK